MKSPAILILIISVLIAGNRPERTLSQTIQGDQVRTLTTWSHAISDSVGVFYSPGIDHFRLRYELDPENRSSRSWERHWGWVEVFYRGNVLSRGWTANCGRILGYLPESFHQDDLIKRMNVLGRLVASEWSRRNNIRLITTNDLIRWGSLLRRAIRNRDQDGAVSILEIFSQIEVEVYRRLSPLTRRFERLSGA